MKFVWWLITVVWCIAGAANLIIGTEGYLRARSASGWPSVAGEVIDARVSSFPGTHKARFYPDIRYRYQVEGQSYEGWRINVIEGSAERGDLAKLRERDAIEAIQPYTAGSNVQVFHDPSNPGESQLDPEAFGAATDDFWAGVVMSALGAFMLFRKLRAWKKSRHQVWEHYNLAFRHRSGWRVVDAEDGWTLILASRRRKLNCYVSASASEGNWLPSSGGAANGRAGRIKDRSESYRELRRWTEPRGGVDGTWIEVETRQSDKDYNFLIVGHGHRGFEHQIVLSGPKKHLDSGQAKKIMEEELLPQLTVLDPQRSAYSLLPPFEGSFTSTFTGFRFASQEAGWRRWNALQDHMEDGEFGVLHEDGGILSIQSVRLPDREVPFAAVVHGLLGFFAFEETSKELHEVDRQMDGPSPFAVFRALRAGEKNRYEFRLLVQCWPGGAALVCYGAEPENPTLDQNFAAARAAFSIPGEGPTEEELDPRSADIRAAFSFPGGSNKGEDLDARTKDRQATFLGKVGQWCSKHGDKGTANEILANALALTPTDVEALFALLQGLVSSESYERALAVLDSHESGFAGNLILQSYRPFLYRRVSRLQESRTEYEALFAAGARDIEDLRDYVAVLSDLKENEAAIEAIKTWIAEDDRAELHQLMAQILRRTGAHDEAIAVRQALVDKNPHDVDHRIGLAHEYSQARQYQEAVAVCDAIVERGGSGAGVSFARGIAEDGLEWYPQALRSFEEALSLEPTNEHFRSWVDHVTTQMGQGNTRLIRKSIPALDAPDLGDTTEEERSAFASAAAMYLGSSIVVSHREGEALLRTRRERILIQTRQGVARYSTFRIPFNPEGESLFVNDVRVTDPSGNTVFVGEVAGLFVKDKEGSEGSSEKVVHVPIEGLTPGAVIDIIWTVRLHGVQEKIPFYRECLGRGTPVVRSQLVIRGDVADLSVQTFGKIREKEGDGWKRFEARAIQGAPGEPFSMRDSKWREAVWFGTPAKSWEEVGRDHLKRIEHRLAPSKEIETLAAELIAGVDNDDAKVAILAAHVRKKLDYKAIEFGPRGLVPNDVDDIRKANFGDCKDHSVFFFHLMRAAGLRCELVLVDTNETVCEEIPTLSQFNHMINYCPDLGGGRFVDCVDKEQGVCVQIPYGLQSRKAFRLDLEESRLAEIGEIPDDQETLDIDRLLFFPEGSALEGSGPEGKGPEGNDLVVEDRLSLTGYVAAFFRRFMRRTDSSQEDRMRELLTHHDSRAHLMELELEGFDDLEAPFTLRIRYRLAGALERVEGRVTAKIPTYWEQDYFVPAHVVARTSPFEIGDEFALRSTTILAGLDAATIRDSLDTNLPESSAEGPFVHWTREITDHDDGARIRVEMRRLKGRFDADQYASFREASERAVLNLEQRFVVKR